MKEIKEDIKDQIEQLAANINTTCNSIDVDELMILVEDCEDESSLDSLYAGLTWVNNLFEGYL
jgi:enamine deaminase RidA (YjgF/YER057c/UK114 family)